MKTIVKSEVPPCLRQAQGKGWNWDEFRANAYDDYLSVRSQALVDQKNECAYTGLWLGMGTTHTLHIDHFHKKAIFPEETLSWENLFAAAKNRNNTLQDLFDDDIRQCTKTAGFSFLVDFELSQLSNRK